MRMDRHKIKVETLSSIVEGGECLHRPNCQASLDIVLHEMSLLFWHFINATAGTSLHLLPLESSQHWLLVTVGKTFS